MAEELRKEIKDGQQELKEQSQAQYDRLAQMMLEMSVNQKKSSEEAK